MKCCHLYSFIHCPAKHPDSADSQQANAVSAARSPCLVGWHTLTFTVCWYFLFFSHFENFLVFVGGPFLYFLKITSLTRTGFLPSRLWAGFFVYFVFDFLHLSVIIPEPAWAVSYFILFRTELYDFYRKVLCQLLFHQQRHPNFMANPFLFHYL